MKKINKALVFVLAFVLVAVSLFAVPKNSDAAAKLNKKKLKMYVGDTFKLKVSGTKGVKWSSSNKKVASVSKKGLVKAKKQGKAKITAKCGKKKLNCTVTVKKDNSFTSTTVNVSAETLEKNIDIKAEKLPSGQILFTITNNNEVNVPKIYINAELNDSTGAPVTTHKITIYDLREGATTYSIYQLVKANCEASDVSRTVFDVTADPEKTFRTHVENKIKITSSVNEEKQTVLTMTNTSSRDLFINGYMFFKDANGTVIGASSVTETVPAGETLDVPATTPRYKLDTPEHKAFSLIEYVSTEYVYDTYYQVFTLD